MLKRKLHILYFAPCGLYGGVGGSARLEDMTRLLQKLDVNIKLICYISGSKFEIKHKKINENLYEIRIVISKLAPKILKAFAIPAMILFGLKYAKKSDLIFSHSPGLVSCFPAMIISKLSDKPLIIDHMDVKDPDTPTFIHDLNLISADCIFTISRFLEDEVNRKYGANPIYLPIFTDTNVIKINKIERKKYRTEMGILDSEILIGYAGSFWYVEGIPVLLKAFKELLRNHPNTKLMLIGGKNLPDADDIPTIINEMKLKDKIIQIPRQPREAIPKYLSACDILCAPKLDCEINRAANPAKVVDYLSMGLPTVCSAIGGITDIIKDGYNGLLVEPGNIVNLEKKLEWIISNPTSAKKLGANGRKTVIDQYSYDAVEKIIIKTINEILKNRTGG